MKLKTDADLVDFIHAVKTCKSDVCFVTKEGDRLNLKSTLCQYLFVALVSSPELLYNGLITCEAEDLPLIQDYLC